MHNASTFSADYALLKQARDARAELRAPLIMSPKPKQQPRSRPAPYTRTKPKERVKKNAPAAAKKPPPTNGRCHGDVATVASLLWTLAEGSIDECKAGNARQSLEIVSHMRQIW